MSDGKALVPLGRNGRPAPVKALRSGPLQPWMRAYGRWLLSPGQLRRPTLQQRTAKASELAGFPIPKSALIALGRRPDFRAYLTVMDGNAVQRAKDEFEQSYEFYVQSHQAGLIMALAAKDHRAIANFTTPVLDRIAPKKAEAGGGKSTVVIQMNVAQVEKLHAMDDAEIVVEKPEVEEG